MLCEVENAAFDIYPHLNISHGLKYKVSYDISACKKDHQNKSYSRGEVFATINYSHFCFINLCRNLKVNKKKL
eukprot:UN23632